MVTTFTLPLKWTPPSLQVVKFHLRTRGGCCIAKEVYQTEECHFQFFAEHSLGLVSRHHSIANPCPLTGLTFRRAGWYLLSVPMCSLELPVWPDTALVVGPLYPLGFHLGGLLGCFGCCEDVVLSLRQVLVVSENILR